MPIVRTAYVIAIGIDNYVDRDLALSYAKSDANLFADAIEKSLMDTGRYSHVKSIRMLDGESTWANVQGVLTQLAGGTVSTSLAPKFRFPRPQAQDAVFFYFAGHGAFLKNQFRLIMHDFERETLKNSINDDALRNAMASTVASDLVIVIDACQSGKIMGDDLGRYGPFDSGTFSQMAYDKGVFALVATQSQGAAKELSELGHGVLTDSLIVRGLQRKQSPGPRAGESVISIREFLQFPVEDVPLRQRTKRLQVIEKSPPRESSRASGLRLLALENEPPEAIQRPRAFFPPVWVNPDFIVGKKE